MRPVDEILAHRGATTGLLLTPVARDSPSVHFTRRLDERYKKACLNSKRYESKSAHSNTSEAVSAFASCLPDRTVFYAADAIKDVAPHLPRPEAIPAILEMLIRNSAASFPLRVGQGRV